MECDMFEDQPAAMASTTGTTAITARMIVHTSKKKLQQIELDFQQGKKDVDLRRKVLLKSILRFAREQRKRKQPV